MAALLPSGSDALQPVAGGSCLAAAALLYIFAGRGSRTGAAIALFFCLGLFCHASRAAAGPLPEILRTPAERALAGLLRAIDGAGFQHERTGGLLKALLAGRREGLDRDIVAAFRTAGASHILALSGLHLGILCGILRKGLAVLGRSRAAAAIRSGAAVGFSACYLAMTGAPPSLVRAFLFILLGELSRLLPGRRRRPMNIFCAALLLQLTFSPAVVHSLGFQLSYLAMLGIHIVFPRLEAWYPAGIRHDPFRRIWSAAALTLSCQLFTAPLVWLRFRTFPKYFLLTNLCALPLTEAFIFSALPAILWPGCPQGIKNLADGIGQILLSFLETLATVP